MDVTAGAMKLVLNGASKIIAWVEDLMKTYSTGGITGVLTKMATSIASTMGSAISSAFQSAIGSLSGIPGGLLKMFVNIENAIANLIWKKG